MHLLAEVLYNLALIKLIPLIKKPLNCIKVIVIRQEESRSISENFTWGQRKRFADGKVSLPYKQFLGYEKGEDGLPKIVEKEASVVRSMYKFFFEGRTPAGIARQLTTNKIPTPGGKDIWQPSTVLSILKNEKYKGDAILRKTFTVDFLTKKKKINEGEISQYYVKNSHPAIITPEVFDLVQHEFKKRKNVKGYKTGGGCFSGKIVCGECGSFYGSKVWHSNSKNRK
ncbi:recombinase family protein [Clostridium estertheticum]|uniref:recombinase family protein n=1 Tax=Clostridium estertheticum TaxID=238834 RepID=UPI00227BB96C|nr:recombinase family protein [Clostridium estertheticum]WAG66490.1 recombinase family protein [Clostridium estertheticum]